MYVEVKVIFQPVYLKIDAFGAPLTTAASNEEVGFHLTMGWKTQYIGFASFQNSDVLMWILIKTHGQEETDASDN